MAEESCKYFKCMQRYVQAEIRIPGSLDGKKNKLIFRKGNKFTQLIPELLLIKKNTLQEGKLTINYISVKIPLRDDYVDSSLVYRMRSASPNLSRFVYSANIFMKYFCRGRRSVGNPFHKVEVYNMTESGVYLNGMPSN